MKQFCITINKSMYTMILFFLLNLVVLIDYSQASDAEDYIDKKILYDNSKLLQLSEFEVLKLRQKIREEEIAKSELYEYEYDYYYESQNTENMRNQKKYKNKNGKSFAEIAKELKKNKTQSSDKEFENYFIDFD